MMRRCGPSSSDRHTPGISIEMPLMSAGRSSVACSSSASIREIVVASSSATSFPLSLGFE
jgi:hypothetical protein